MKKLLSIALCICLTLAAVFVVAPSFNKANAATQTANELLTAYYNGGSYVKDTEIYAAGLGVGDEGNFHAKASASNRKTVYSKGNTVLYMTGADVKEGGYQDKNGKVERFHYDENGQEVHDFWVNDQTSIKAWFTDLEEFKSATWTQNDNVYTTKATVAWINFIAPMWEAYDLIEETDVTMQNTAQGLVFELYGNIGEAENCKFAKATITIPSQGWVQITDIADLKVGDTITFAGGSNHAKLGEYNNDKHIFNTAEDFANSTELTVEAGTVDGTFAFKTNDKYLGYTGSSNEIYVDASKENAQSWSVTATEENKFRITNANTTERFLQYNASNTRFACYKESSNQSDVYIYEYTVTGVAICYHNNTTTEVTATCTKDGETIVTCDDCHVVISVETTNALGHTTEEGTCERCGETIGTDAPAEKTWQLVTDVNTLKADDQIVIVAAGSAVALSTTQNNNNRGQATVTKDGDTVTFGDDVQIITLEAGTKTGTFAFNTGSGYLYAASSSSNNLKTKTTLDDNGSWTISVTAAGVATIKANGTYSRNWLRYNSGSSIFSCYSSGQADVSIYKLTDGSVCDHANTTTTTVDATCTEAGSTTITCEDCGETISTEPIPATGHNFVDGVCSVCGEEESSAVVEETTVSTTIADCATANSWADATKYTSFKMGDDITVTATGGGNTGKYYTNGTNWRIYQNENPTVTITAEEGKTIVSVKITYAVSNTGVLTLNGTNVTSGTVVEVNANSITFSVGNTGSATNGQVRITAIEVVYA